MLNRPPLPAAWIERLFARLIVVYGHAFLGRWSGLDLDAVKRSWAEELAGFAEHPGALNYGLENLPAGEPPTVLQFRDLCRPALRDERQPVAPALSAPKADLEKVAELVASVARDVVFEPRAWAHALKAREEGGASLTPYQRDAWRTALAAQS